MLNIRCCTSLYFCRVILLTLKAMVLAIPIVISKASSKKLKEAMPSHLEMTKGLISRLKKVFGLIRLKLKVNNVPPSKGDKKNFCRNAG
jgi:ferritin-like metal-binding protein YciE